MSAGSRTCAGGSPRAARASCRRAPDRGGGRAGTDALLAIANAYRGYGLAHPGTYEALQRAPELDDPVSEAAARRLVDVVIAVLRGYGLEGDDVIHGVRIVRAALHGFVTLEAGGGFGLPLSVDDTFERLVTALDRGLSRA